MGFLDAVCGDFERSPFFHQLLQPLPIFFWPVRWRFVFAAFDDFHSLGMHVAIPFDDELLFAFIDARLLGAVVFTTAFDDVDVQQMLLSRHIVNARVCANDVGPRLDGILEGELWMSAMIDSSDAPERSGEVCICICVNCVNRDFVPVLEGFVDAIDARVSPLRVHLLASTTAIDALQLREQLLSAQDCLDVCSRCVVWVPIRPFCGVVWICIVCHGCVRK
jgi:hypothetical protein